MYGNTSLMTDTNLTFFGDQDYTGNKENIQSKKDFTKNSSNPEKDYKEFDKEITRVRENNLNSSNSRNNELTFGEGQEIYDSKIWRPDNNETQDSTQYRQTYISLAKKEKATPKNKAKKRNIIIPNNNFIKIQSRLQLEDYSADTDEYACSNVKEEEDDTVSLINRISTINVKNNNIDALDKNSNKFFNSRNYCITEPEEFYGNRPFFSGSFQGNGCQFMNSGATPSKDERSMSILYHSSRRNPVNFASVNFNSYENNFLNPPGFPRLGNRGSIISKGSTHFSSNKKNGEMINLEEGEYEKSMEVIDNISINEENYFNDQRCQTYGNNYHQSLSDRKARLPTSESVESNNSAQYNYFRNNPLTGMNLNHQFSTNTGNLLYFHDEESRKKFSASFNDNTFFLPSPRMETAFTFTNIPQAGSHIISNREHTQQCMEPRQIRHKMNKHTKSETNYRLKPNNGGEKNILNLEDIATGRDLSTTVMIRNIPIKYSDEMLLKELEEFMGKFDCVYLPYDAEKKGNRGYAFINFTHPLHILLFYEKFEGKTWNYFESRKICELNAANYQGIAEIRKHAKNYKSIKKPSFFQIADGGLSNIEVPMKYRNQILISYPNIILEDSSYGLVKLKSIGNK